MSGQEQEEYHVINDSIKIKRICLKTFPCKHRITIDGKEQTMSSPAIYKLLRDKNLQIPEHFSFYKNDE